MSKVKYSAVEIRFWNMSDEQEQRLWTQLDYWFEQAMKDKERSVRGVTAVFATSLKGEPKRK